MSYTELLIHNWIVVLIILISIVVGVGLLADDYTQVRDGQIVTDVLEQREPRP